MNSLCNRRARLAASFFCAATGAELMRDGILLSCSQAVEASVIELGS